jgi:hypothetical protein
MSNGTYDVRYSGLTDQPALKFKSMQMAFRRTAMIRHNTIPFVTLEIVLQSVPIRTHGQLTLNDDRTWWSSGQPGQKFSVSIPDLGTCPIA